jgi:putative peptide zinc metalloprotease protein
MSSQYPKLRTDLVISEVTQGGEASYVIKDPLTRRFFRLKEHEAFIARKLDGTTSPEEVLSAFETQFGAALPESSLERFIRRIETLCLTDRGLATGEIVRLQRSASTEAGLTSKLLGLRLRAIDPERLLRALAPYTRFCFTRGFLIAGAVVTLAAIGITAVRWNMYVAQAKDLFRPGMIPTFVLVALVVTVLHEFAHAFTCKHYGGEVHEMGFLLIYLVPAFYCNVSDAWLFSDKAKRLWVSAAGTMFQVVLYALAAIAWAFLARGTWLSDACALTIAIAGLTALFNFNPLIKLDGYYLLSDYLAIPNLRKRAFAYLGSEARRVLGRWVLGRPARQHRELTPRDRRIYLVYGITAGAYSLGLLIFVVFKIVAFIVSVVPIRN